MNPPSAEFLGPRAKRLVRRVVAPFISRRLNALAMLYQTDKWNEHWYTQHYQSHFLPLRKRPLNILEIGVGGYRNPTAGGASLYMWKYFFPKSQIFAIDIEEKRLPKESRIHIFQGHQTDRKFLERLVGQDMQGKLDIVIDDGSHVVSDVLTTFEILFPMVTPSGYYVVEDIQTSYWPYAGGDDKDLNNPATSMNFFKSLTDSLNYQEFAHEGYDPSIYDRNVVSVHFYHNLVFVRKGSNDEGTIRHDREVRDR